MVAVKPRLTMTDSPSDEAPPLGVEIRDVAQSWPGPNEESYTAISGVNLSIPDGEFLSIVGPSGCGKSTLLRIIAGLESPSSGEVLIGGRKVEGTRPEVAMVFQEASLYPWLTAAGNVAFGPALSGVPPHARRRDALEWLAKVGLAEFARYFPHQLSGGMKQRVAIARALANGARVLLMDEPFAALDYQVRRQMQELLLDLWRELGKTVVFVTHHIDEAVLLSDRVALFSSGPAANVTETITLPMARPRRLHDPEIQRICAEIIAHVEEQGFNGSSTRHG